MKKIYLMLLLLIGISCNKAKVCSNDNIIRASERIIEINDSAHYMQKRIATKLIFYSNLSESDSKYIDSAKMAEKELELDAKLWDIKREKAEKYSDSLDLVCN